MRYFFLFVILFLGGLLHAQIGINTTAPNAQLDIQSSNQATPLPTDGILIPKVDAFPSTNPTAAQQGMLVYLTTNVGLKTPGFYYWDQPTATWVGIYSDKKGDADFFEVGGTAAPDNINDEIYHLGKVKIGTTTNIDGKLDLISDENQNWGIHNQKNFSVFGTGTRATLYNEVTGFGDYDIIGNGNDIFLGGNGTLILDPHIF